MQRASVVFLFLFVSTVAADLPHSSDLVRQGLRPTLIDWRGGEVPLIVPRNTECEMFFSKSGYYRRLILDAGEPVVAKLVASETTDEYFVYDLSRVMRCANRIVGRVKVLRHLRTMEKVRVEVKTEIQVEEKIMEVIREVEVPVYYERETIKTVERPVLKYEYIIVQAPTVYPTGSLPGPVIQTFPRVSSFNAGVWISRVESPGFNVSNLGNPVLGEVTATGGMNSAVVEAGAAVATAEAMQEQAQEQQQQQQQAAVTGNS